MAGRLPASDAATETTKPTARILPRTAAGFSQNDQLTGKVLVARTASRARHKPAAAPAMAMRETSRRTSRRTRKRLHPICTQDAHFLSAFGHVHGHRGRDAQCNDDQDNESKVARVPFRHLELLDRGNPYVRRPGFQVGEVAENALNHIVDGGPVLEVEKGQVDGIAQAEDPLRGGHVDHCRAVGDTLAGLEYPDHPKPVPSGELDDVSW